MPVLPEPAPPTLAERYQGPLPIEPAADVMKALSCRLQELIAQGIHLQHPGYIGHQVGAPLPAASLAELVTGVFNQSMAVYEMSPSATHIERQTARWLCNLIGWGKEADGVFTSGGSLGNLTALLVAAMLSMYPESSFTEMFCADWENNTVFLSHMGELNWRLADGKPRLREMDYKYSRTDNPALLAGRFKPGEIVLVNLAPTAGGYRLILAPARMLAVPGTDRFADTVHGWFAPGMPVADFLAAYSRAGGTHHLGLSYTANTRTLETFGRMMGWEVVLIA
jgi:hypothetical protein